MRDRGERSGIGSRNIGNKKLVSMVVHMPHIDYTCLYVFEP